MCSHDAYSECDEVDLEEPLRKQDSERREGASFRFILSHQETEQDPPTPLLQPMSEHLCPLDGGALPTLCPQPLKRTWATGFLGNGV